MLLRRRTTKLSLLLIFQILMNGIYKLYIHVLEVDITVFPGVHDNFSTMLERLQFYLIFLVLVDGDA